MAWDIGADEYVSGTTERSAIVTAVEFETPIFNRRAIVTAVEFEAPFSAPANVTAGTPEDIRIPLTWTDPNTPDLPIRPFVRETGNEIWNIASLSLPPGTTYYMFEELSPITQYDLGVAAWDDPDQSIISYDTATTTSEARTAIVTAAEFEVSGVAARTAIVTAVEFETTGGARSAIVTAVEFEVFEAGVIVTQPPPYQIQTPNAPYPEKRYDRENEVAFRREVENTYPSINAYISSTLPVYGMLYVGDGGTGQSIGATPEKITGFTGVGPSLSTTPSAPNDQIVVGEDGLYKLDAQLAFSGSVSEGFELHFYVNGVATDFGTHRVLGTGGDVGSCSITGFVSLSAGDAVSIYVNASAASKTFTLVDGQLLVMRLT